MELRDLIVTPIVIFLVYWAAYFIRPYVTDPVNRRYFFPALTVRVFGAITLGVVYQFYYGGGDTFTYHTLGSRIVWEAFTDSPISGLRLLFGGVNDVENLYDYVKEIYFFRDSSSYFVVRIASALDLLTFSSYSATAVLFSIISFVGMWMLFITFYKQYPHLHRGISLATLFLPSVFFWGSGLLKDTIIIGALGIATYYFYRLFFEKKISVSSIFILLCALYSIYSVKIFILQAYLPSVIMWIMTFKFGAVRSVVLKMMLLPMAAILIVLSSYYSIIKVGEGNSKYSLSNFADTAHRTAHDIRFWSGREAGSGYIIDVGEWTAADMLRAAPAAINVSLFRPYLWEVKNFLMVISSFESTFVLLFTLYIITTRFKFIVSSLGNFNVIFCFIFSISYAFAVGISTFNFGTLARYKIPLLPFYLIGLIIIMDAPNLGKRQGTLINDELTSIQ